MLSFSIFTHACKHLRTPFHLRLSKTSISAFYLWCNSCDRCGFLTPIEKRENKLATPAWSRRDVWVKPVSSWARVGRAGSVESESCTWQLSFGLHLPKNETQTLSAAPEPEPPSQRSNIQDWVILFTKQNITSNYSRPVFYSLLPHVGFIAVCKCQDTYKDAQYKWYFPNYAHMFGFTWVAAERNVVPDAPEGDPPH